MQLFRSNIWPKWNLIFKGVTIIKIIARRAHWVIIERSIKHLLGFMNTRIKWPLFHRCPKKSFFINRLGAKDMLDACPSAHPLGMHWCAPRRPPSTPNFTGMATPPPPGYLMTAHAQHTDIIKRCGSCTKGKSSAGGDLVEQRHWRKGKIFPFPPLSLFSAFLLWDRGWDCDHTAGMHPLDTRNSSFWGLMFWLFSAPPPTMCSSPVV